MNDLVKQIVEKTGIPADKAQQVLGVVGGFIKQKFPMVGSQVDSILGTGGDAATGDAKTDSNDLLGGLGSKFGL